MLLSVGFVTILRYPFTMQTNTVRIEKAQVLAFFIFLDLSDLISCQNKFNILAIEYEASIYATPVLLVKYDAILLKH